MSDDRELLEAEARDRWGDEWAIEVTHWADGDRDLHAYHQQPTDDPDVKLVDRLFIGSDGDVYHDRVRVDPERILEVVERDEPPDASENAREE